MKMKRKFEDVTKTDIKKVFMLANRGNSIVQCGLKANVSTYIAKRILDGDKPKKFNKGISTFMMSPTLKRRMGRYK